MLLPKFLITGFAFCAMALSCVAARETIVVARDGATVKKRRLSSKSNSSNSSKSKKKKKLKYRTFGTASPDPNLGTGENCYRNVYYDKKGETALGDYIDCVISAPVINYDPFEISFNVTTTFDPYDEGDDTLVTTCFVTVSPDQTVGPVYNAVENCKNNNGVLSPEGQEGKVKLEGLVNNTQSPTLTFDLLWTINLK